MLIRVLEVPPSDGRYCFDGGNSQIWNEVDWFRDDEHPLTPETEKEYRDFLEPKRYNKGQPLLVLGPRHSFTINYNAE